MYISLFAAYQMWSKFYNLMSPSKMNKEYGARKNAPGKNAPRKNSPRKIAPPENCSPLPLKKVLCKASLCYGIS